MKFRLAGRWYECTIAEFGYYLGLYSGGEYGRGYDLWEGADWNFPDEEDRRNPEARQMRAAAWNRIASGPYDPSSSKSTKLRDPLHRYIHRLVSHTVNQRGMSSGVVNLRDLWCLDCIINNNPCNLGYLFAQLLHTNARAGPATPLFGGGWIVQLYANLGHDVFGTAGPEPNFVDLALCESMRMVVDVPDQGPRFVDSRGNIWDPEDPEHFYLEMDMPDPQPQQPHDQAGPSSSSSSFPSMMDLYNAINESTSYSRQAYELAQETNRELRHMRRRMDRHWGPDDQMGDE